MGLFDFLRKAPPEPPAAPEDPDELRDALFDAAGSGDSTIFGSLVEARADLIVANFEAWTVVPEEVRGEPAMVRWNFQGVLTIAEHFAQERGDDSLLERLKGDVNDPITLWQAAIEAAEAHLTAGEWDAAHVVLSEQLEIVRQLQGGSAPTMLTMTLGTIGRCHFSVGRIDEAIGAFAEVLELARDAEDLPAENAYLGNLAELFLYEGDSEQAADCFEEQAALQRESGAVQAADRTDERAVRVRAGLPLNRVVAIMDEVAYEIDDLPRRDDLQVQFVFQRSRPALPASARKIQDGMEHGSAGRYPEALAAFEEAAAIDPFDPQAPYRRGVTLLHLGRYADARDSFEETERLAPGWYQARADRWIAGELAEGRLPPEALDALRAMEGEESPDAKAKLAAAALEVIGRFPHLELELGRQNNELGHVGDARDVWRAALELDPEPDVRSRLLTQLGLSTNKRSESRGLLEEALQVEGGNLIVQATAQIALRTKG